VNGRSRPGPPAAPIGRIGRYLLERELGRGAMGVVYAAWDSTLKRPVAIKMILDTDKSSREDVARFEREARAASKLRHPGIVAIHEAGEHEGKLYMVLELVDGTSLDAWLKRSKLSPQRAAKIVRELALALEHAHEQKIIHRDVKPANVLLDESGQPRLLDFGLARSGFSVLTAPGDIVGTPVYMAPEQARGDPEAHGPHTDIYALGGVLYRCLAGRPPFTAKTIDDVLTKVVEAMPLPPSQLDPTVPRDLEAIALRCLAKEPRDRYPSAAAVATAIDRWLGGLPQEVEEPEPAKRRVPVWPIAAGTVVFFAVLALAFKLAGILWP
jgi:serine/threonine protein kinase